MGHDPEDPEVGGDGRGGGAVGGGGGYLEYKKIALQVIFLAM